MDIYISRALVSELHNAAPQNPALPVWRPQLPSLSLAPEATTGRRRRGRGRGRRSRCRARCQWPPTPGRVCVRVCVCLRVCGQGGRAMRLLVARARRGLRWVNVTPTASYGMLSTMSLHSVDIAQLSRIKRRYMCVGNPI